MNHTSTIRRLPAALHPVLVRRLRGYGRLLKARDAAADAGLFVLVVGGLVAVSLGFDRLVDVPGIWRLPLLGLTLAAAAVLAIRFLVRLCRRADYDALAHGLDTAAGDTRGQLRSVLDFSRRGLPADSFAGRSADRAVDFWRERPVGVAVDRRPLWPCLYAVPLVLVLGGLSRIEAVRGDLLLRRFLDPLGNHMRPTATWLEVEPPPREGLKGGDAFTIRARLRGRPPADPVPLARVSTTGEAATVGRMRLRDGVWELPLVDVRRDFDFVVSMAAARSESHHVAVVPRPEIVKVAVSYQFPKYTGLPPRQETLAGRTITAIEGTKVRIEVTGNVPLKSVVGVIGGEQQRFTIDPRDPARASAFHYLAANARMELAVVARNGLDNAKELPLTFRVVPDAPPVVVATNDPGERPLFPGEILSIAFKAQDDIGLAEVGVSTTTGEFGQEADLEKQGMREAAGVIRVPVASVLRPGANSVQLRLTSLDGKGQRGVSPAITVRIASNSYERQLRAAIRSLTGQHRAVSAEAADTAGFPSIERHAQRLKSLRALHAKLTLLREFTGDAPDENQAKQSADARRLIAELQPGLPYLVPYVTPGHGAMRAIYLLGRMPLTNRLEKIVRDATCGAELAVPTESLLPMFEAAVKEADPRAGLAAMQESLEPMIARQELVTQRLSDFLRTVKLELAGSLATRLSRGSYADADRDAVVAGMTRLKELAGLLEGEATAEQKASLAAILEEQDEVQGLTRAAALLAEMLPGLVAAAAEQAEKREVRELPVGAFLRGLESQPGSDWKEVYSLWVGIQADDLDADEESLLHHGQALLRLVAGRPFAPPDDAAAADADGFRLARLLARLADQAAAVRVGLVTGRAAANPPAFEAAWLLLREMVFELKLLAKAGGGVPEDFLAGLVPTAAWLPPPDAADLPGALAGWEREARLLAAEHAAAGRRRLEALCQESQTWPEEATAAVDAYLGEIDGLVRALAEQENADLVYQQLPRFSSRLAAIAAVAAETFNVAEAARLHGVGTGLDLARLAAVRVAVQKFEANLLDTVGAVGNAGKAGVTDQKEAQRVLAKGRIRALEEHRTLIGSIRELCADIVPPAVQEEVLQRLVARHVVEQERKEYESAVAIASGPPTPAAELLALPGADGGAAPAFWGEVVCVVSALQRAVATGDAAVVADNLVTLRTYLSGLPSLPREARSLAAWDSWTASALQADSARGVEEIGTVIEELRPLAQPPAVYPAQERLAHLRQAVWRARLRPGGEEPGKVALAWALTELEWGRRRQEVAARQVGIGGLQVAGDDEFAGIKLPKHIYLELKRAREGVFPELYKDRSHKYLSTILEKAR